jgi:hypothetical protein
VPVAEVPQHMQALARANRVRLARAELKRSIGRGEVDVAEILDPAKALPEEAESMPVCQLLAAQHRWGVVRTRRALGRLEIKERREVGALTRRERSCLVAVLRREDVRAQSDVGPRPWIKGWGPEVLG